MKNLITAGCSFTAGSSLKSVAKETPSTWLHFVVNHFDLDVIVNLAIPGGGNTATEKNLIYWFENNKWMDNSNTIVGFNITGLDRIDTICPADHPDSNSNFSWNKHFNFSWITQGGFLALIPPYYGSLQKNFGYDQTIALNALSVISSIHYLKSKNIKYFFMIMDNTILNDAPEWFLGFLESEKNNWIVFDQCSTMHDLAKTRGLLDNDKFHPSRDGYKEISKYVCNFIEKNNLL